MECRSILIYLLVFLTTIFLTYLWENILDNHNRFKKEKKVIPVMIILLPCILASLRDVTVGTDVRGYLIPNFQIALTCDTFNEFLLMQKNKLEVGFNLLIYLGAMFKSLWVTFFLIEFMIVVPVLYVLYRIRERASMTIGMIIFLFLFYNFSLSGMRQSVAMSLLLLFVYFFKSTSYGYGLIFGVLSFLFHKSAIIFMVIFMGCYALYLCIREKEDWSIYAVIIFSLFTMIFYFYDLFANVIADILFYIHPRYSYYIKHFLEVYQGIKWENIYLTDLLCKTTLVVAFYSCFKYKSIINSEVKFMLLLMAIGRFIVVFNSRFYEAMRMSIYFDYLYILFLPICKECCKDRLDEIVAISFVFICCVAYWLKFIIINGGYGTNIYVFC